ncbi:MAG: alpha/beta fold hydrolase [Pseudomonadota bacterium]
MTKPETLPLFVLIHGAWQGSWAFAEWAPLLQRRGCNVVAVDLPGNCWPPENHAPANLASYCTSVLDVIKRHPGPVILVGHSGGGITASQVAELAPERVAAVVYLAGIMLPSDRDLGEVIQQCVVENPGIDFDGITTWLEYSPCATVSRVRPEGALTCFVQDCDPVKALHAVRQLRPQQESGRLMKPVLTEERFGTVPRLYVECTADESLVLPLQRKMQQLSPGAQALTMHCGHVPQLAQPERLTDLLLPALGKLLSPALRNPMHA